MVLSRIAAPLGALMLLWGSGCYHEVASPGDGFVTDAPTDKDLPAKSDRAVKDGLP